MAHASSSDKYTNLFSSYRTLLRSSAVHSEPEFEQQRLKSGDSVMVEIVYHCSSRGVVGLTA